MDCFSIKTEKQAPLHFQVAEGAELWGSNVSRERIWLKRPRYVSTFFLFLSPHYFVCSSECT